MGTTLWQFFINRYFVYGIFMVGALLTSRAVPSSAENVMLLGVNRVDGWCVQITWVRISQKKIWNDKIIHLFIINCLHRKSDKSRYINELKARNNHYYHLSFPYPNLNWIPEVTSSDHLSQIQIDPFFFIEHAKGLLKCMK